MQSQSSKVFPGLGGDAECEARQVQTSADKCKQVARKGKTKTWGHADAQTQLNLYVRLPYAVALALGIKKSPNRNS